MWYKKPNFISAFKYMNTTLRHISAHTHTHMHTHTTHTTHTQTHGMYTMYMHIRTFSKDTYFQQAKHMPATLWHKLCAKSQNRNNYCEVPHIIAAKNKITNMHITFETPQDRASKSNSKIFTNKYTHTRT